MDLSSNTTHCVGNLLFFPARSQIPVPLMNPAPSNPALLSRLFLAKPAVVLGFALALFGLPLAVAKAEKLRIGVSMKTLNAPYFAAAQR
jgi:hypothetical protein